MQRIEIITKYRGHHGESAVQRRPGAARIRKMSTEQAPYHFVGSGLENVYLVGVEYEVTTDGFQAADIPCLPKLLEAIGKVLAEKKTALTADEMRFLRKRIRWSSKDFAALIGLSSEQYSRIEKRRSSDADRREGSPPALCGTCQLLANRITGSGADDLDGSTARGADCRLPG